MDRKATNNSNRHYFVSADTKRKLRQLMNTSAGG